MWKKIKKWFYNRYLDCRVTGRVRYDSSTHQYVCVEQKKHWYIKLFK